MRNVIRRDKNILGGTPCFAGTRVPVRSLFDHLSRGYTIDEFLTQFPTVRRKQVEEVLEQSKLAVETPVQRAAAG
jgi:uncharacterized protein (DUF433 family)